MGTSINPATPVYSKAVPVYKETCIGCLGRNQSFFNPANAGKTAEVLSGNQIDVTDLSDSAVDRFKTDYVPIVQLTASLVLVAKAATVSLYDSSDPARVPILSGTTIDELDLTWSYNNDIASQTLENEIAAGGQLSEPTLDVLDRAHNYSGLSLTGDITFTLTGNDGLGNGSQSLGISIKTLPFGNYIVWGKGSSLIGNNLAGVQSFFETLIAGSGKAVDTGYTRNVLPEGGVNEKFFVLYPKAWGLATFKKGIFVGGMMRLKMSQANSTLTPELAGGDVEIDVSLDNGNPSAAPGGFDENYYIFESLFDNQADTETPIEIY